MLSVITALIGALAYSGCVDQADAPLPVDVVVVRSVTSVTVSPHNLTLASGDAQRLTAHALDAAGHVMNGIDITWESLDTAVAIVSSGGLVVASRAGLAKVRAMAAGHGDTSLVTVSAPPVPTLPTTIIFSDDFESGTLSKWHDGVNAAKHRVVNDASRAAGGSHFLEITYPSGGEGGWLTRFFMPGYDSLLVSYDVQFESAWTGGTKLLNIRGSRTDNQWSSFGQAGKCPDGAQWFATNVVMLANENPGPIRFYTYYPGMQTESDGVTCWGRHTGVGTTTYSSASALARGVWHRVEVFIKLNSPGQSDGAQRMWVNGQLRGEWTGLALRNTSLLKLNSLTLEGSQMGGTQSATRRLFVDNVVVAH